MERPNPGDCSVPEELAAVGSAADPGGAADVSSIEQGEKQKKVRAKPTCSVCNTLGHTKTTCPQRVTESGDSPVAGAAGGFWLRSCFLNRGTGDSRMGEAGVPRLKGCRSFAGT